MAPTMSVADLLSVPSAQQDADWLETSLQLALQLEFATIPPYLCAMWSITSGSGPAYDLLQEIVYEEMLHLGLVCNLITTLGKTPWIFPNAVPKYPCSLPGGVRPGLKVTLGGLDQVRVKNIFMEIEKPSHDLIDPTDPDPTTLTIGAFYDAIQAKLQALPGTDFTGARQVTRPDMGDALDQTLFPIKSKDDALKAIELIKEQGEGTTASPRDPAAGDSADQDDMAHFYKFTELYQGKKIVKDPASGKYTFSSTATVPFPDTYPMAEVPEGGWQGPGEPAALATFDLKYTAMLKLLQSAWELGSSQKLNMAAGAMMGLTPLGTQLMQIEIAPGGKHYGPCFRIAL